MKKLLFILMVILANASTHAQSKLCVRLTDNSPIKVAVNGRYFTHRGTVITVGDLPAGRHNLKIFSNQYDRRGRESMIYNGMVRTVNGMVTNFTYGPYTYRVQVQRQYINDQGSYSPDNDEQYANRYENEDEKTPSHVSIGTSPKASPVATPITSPTPDEGKAGSFSERKSEQLKQKVNAKGTDTEKLKLVKDELKRESLSTLQVSYIMDWFLFESTKVEFAKWAYNLVSDKTDYNSLSGKFSYKSSKEELDDFLKQAR